jgi:sugar phosphate isomerase/epimerase
VPGRAVPTLVIAHHCLRYASFGDRIDATVRGGFAGLSLSLEVYRGLLGGGMSRADMRAAVEDAGLSASELEVVFLPGVNESASGFRQQVDDFLDMAETFRADHLNASPRPARGGIYDYELFVSSFRELCGRARRAGLTVALEPVPAMSDIPDVITAMALLDEVGADNAGLVIDCFHHFRGPGTLPDIASVPAQRVTCVQLSDALRTPKSADYYTDTCEFRMPPGQGEFDLTGFLGAIRAKGADVPLTVEVLSQSLDRLPPAEVGVILGDATRAVLAKAGEGADRSG